MLRELEEVFVHQVGYKILWVTILFDTIWKLMIEKNILENLYQQGFSMMDIAKKFQVSNTQISYWMHQYGIQRRSIGEAIYRKRNPGGDPFRIKYPLTQYERFLRGLGLGLFWGEGMRLNKQGVRLGNSDPLLILYFRDFLEKICGVKKTKIKYSLQVFGDIDLQQAIDFWCNILTVIPAQLGKPSLVKLRGKGTYKRKNQFGILQIACYNSKLKTIIDGMIRTLKTRKLADVAQLAEHTHGGTHNVSAQILGN